MDFNMFAFPFEQIGLWLRELSLSGQTGNVVAVIIYVLIGFVPCGVYVFLKMKKRDIKADLLLLLLSVFLFAMLYLMVNPMLIYENIMGAGKAVWGATFYSLLIGYMLLRSILSVKKDVVSIQKSLRIVLYAIVILLIGVVAIEFLVNLPNSIETVRQGNTDLDRLSITYVFLTLKSVVTALPNILSVIIIFFCIRTVDALLKDSYSEKTVALVKKVATICKASLVIVLVTSMGFHVAQLVFNSQLLKVSIDINIPLFNILMILLIHMMARYIEENQKLKEDNDLFI